MPMMGSGDALVHHLPAATDGTRGFRRDRPLAGLMIATCQPDGDETGSTGKKGSPSDHVLTLSILKLYLRPDTRDHPGGEAMTSR